jgi:hypothetical protein
MSASNWSAPFHGMQHLDDPSRATRWATVTDHGSFAKLACWYPGCGLRPTVTQHESAAAARTAGERFIAESQVAA